MLILSAIFLGIFLISMLGAIWTSDDDTEVLCFKTMLTAGVLGLSAFAIHAVRHGGIY